MVAEAETIEKVSALAEKYKYGFVTDIEAESAPKGLSEDIVRFISAKKNEPEWMLEWRLKAYRYWLEMESPDWAKLNIPPIDYQDAYYYSAPKSAESRPETIDDVDPALIETYNKLGIPLYEQEMLAGVQKRSVAVDVVFDSVSVATTFRDKLAEALGKKLERQVEVQTSTDSNLLGGVLIRAGDLVIDGSVRGKLDKLAEAMNS